VPRKKSSRTAYVLDSYALLVYLQKQPGWQETGSLLRMFKRERREALLNWINWGEIYYIVRRHFGAEKAQETMELLSTFPLKVHPVTFDLVSLASELKSDYKISYADAFCAATALQNMAIVITGDAEFQALESVIEIRWI
jgi:predicted nucleic acid-binding protein